MGAVMIDTERLFDSLNTAAEFTVTEDHLKLLRHLGNGGLYWDPGEGFGGAPCFGCKKPYGNSNVAQDVAEIVDAPDSDWEWEEGPGWSPAGRPPRVARFKHLRDEAEDRYLRLHVEAAGMALQIVLATGEFLPGRYMRTDAWRNRNNWKRIED
jgi:hypothetical protein